MSNLPPEGYTNSQLTPEALATLQTIQTQVGAGQKNWADAYQFIVDNMPQGYSSGGTFWFEGAIGVNARTDAGSTLSSDYIKYYYRTVAALYDYDITPEKFREATDKIGEGVIGGIIRSGGFLPEVEHIITIDALEGTRILGLPDYHWAGTFVATWGLGVDTFSLGGELALPDTRAEQLEVLNAVFRTGVNLALDYPLQGIIDTNDALIESTSGFAGWIKGVMAWMGGLDGQPKIVSSTLDEAGNRLSSYDTGEKVLFYRSSGDTIQLVKPREGEMSIFGNQTPLLISDVGAGILEEVNNNKIITTSEFSGNNVSDAAITRDLGLRDSSRAEVV